MIGRPASFADTPLPQWVTCMDVLSEVLKAVKLDDAVFYNGEFSAPWCAREPDSHTMASCLSVGSKHVIIFHLVTDGRAYGRLEGDNRPVPLTAGDIIIFPHGDAHLMGNGPPITPTDSAAQLRHILSEGLRLSRCGGGGELTKLICGYMSCDSQLSQIFLAGLPSMIKVNIRDSTSGKWLEDTLRYSVDHAEISGPGGAAVVAKLSEVLFVETLRQYIAQLPHTHTGWLASATRKSGKPWLCSTVDLPILGRSPLLRTRPARLVPSWPSDSDGISRKRPSPT